MAGRFRACGVVWFGGSRRGRALALPMLVGVCGLGLVVPAPAGAAFTREFLGGISTTGSGPLAPDGIAVDGENDVWVESAEASIVEFSPAYEVAPKEAPNHFVKTLKTVASPVRFEALAIEDASDEFYVAGGGNNNNQGPVVVYNAAGKAEEEWGSFPEGGVALAVDNTPHEDEMEDPSACGSLPLSPGECFVYVADAKEDGGIKRMDREGNDVPYAFAKQCEEEKEKCGYVKGGEITGIPGTPRALFAAGVAVAVGSEGQIFAASDETNTVYEYEPSGVFMRAFKLESLEVPELEGHVGAPKGVAFDPVSKHLLVSVEAGLGGSTRVGAIDEFDPATGKFVAQITTAAGGLQFERPVGLAVDSRGDVYVADTKRGVVDVYSSGLYDPTVKLGAAGKRTGTTAVLGGSVNPEGFKLDKCEFEYVTEEAFGTEGFAGPKTKSAQCEPAAAAIPANRVAEAVTGQATGLTAGVVYRYRLSARSEGELGGSAVTPAFAFTAPAAPRIEASGVVSVSSSFAELDGRIDPRGAATSYFFQYGPTSGYGQDAPTAAEAPEGVGIGAGGPTGNASESVVQHLSGLAAGSEYHFRLVAKNEAGTEYGADQTFTTLPEAVMGLPDGRGYELVTPAVKEGGSDMFAEPKIDGAFENEESVGTPSLSGGGFLLETRSAFGVFPGAFLSEYAFHRVPPEGGSNGEWSYTSLASPLLGVQSIGGSVSLGGGSYGVFDPVDLSRVAFTDGVGAELAETGEQPTDLVGAPGGPYTVLHADPAFHASEIQSKVETEVVGASRDLGHIVLESNSDSACPNPSKASLKVEEGDVLCEWDGGYEPLENGEVIPALRFVSLAPGSQSRPASTCGAFLGAGSGEVQGGVHGAVSADGGTVFFTAPQRISREEVPLSGPGCPSSGHPPQLYASVQETEPLGEVVHDTVKVSVPAEGVKEGSGTPKEYPAAYVGASEDGTQVFFISEAWLTADHPEAHDRELYECQLTTVTVEEKPRPKCALTRVSIPVSEAGEPEPKGGSGVDWVPAVSANGSAVYFSAFGVLAEGGAHGGINVYRYDTGSDTTSYVATVGGDDYNRQPSCINELAEQGTGPCTKANWYATPDGGYLLFSDSLPTDGYNSGPQASCTEPLPFTQGFGDGRCSELYRYDAGAAGKGEQPVVCVSCGPGGEDYEGNAEFARSATKEPAAGPPVGISDNGEYVFFDSQARLVSQAENHTLDVYEWHENPVSHTRTVSLISSPNDPFPSYFLGYSPYEYETPAGKQPCAANPGRRCEMMEGGNVFFGTHAQLVAQDTNSVGNIYDARICQPESPCIQPPAGETAQCLGGNCQTPPPIPTDPTATLLPPVTPASGSSSPPKKMTAAEVRAENLVKVLRKCRRDRSRRKRVGCERLARKRYGPVKVAGKSSRAGRAGNGRGAS